MDPERAQALAGEWVEAWRRRDVDALVAHYADDVGFQSLLAAKLLGDPSGLVRGKPALRAFFEKGLAAFPGGLDMELESVFRGVTSIVVTFAVRGRRGAEMMEFDADGRIRRAVAHGQV